MVDSDNICELVENSLQSVLLFLADPIEVINNAYGFSTNG